MPCYTDYGDASTDALIKEKDKSAKFEATLCGLMTYLENNGYLEDALRSIDWKEVGIKRSGHEKWWYEHKEKDARRREEERREIRRKELIEKMSEEDREILGLK